MFRRIRFLVPALLATAFVPAHAANISCALTVGASGPVTTQACDTMLATPDSSLNWSSVLSDTSGLVSGPVGAGGVTVSSTNGFEFEGADNTALAYNGTTYVPAGDVSNATTFAGHFDSQPDAGEPPLGDNLLGIVGNSGSYGQPAEVTLSFASSLSYVEFEVTANVGGQDGSTVGVDSDFVATLVALDANGNILGTYVVTDFMTGGTCPGLSQVPPVPCNDAPFVQFYDEESRIASVELTINDPTGAFIDTLNINAPEPSSFAAFGLGIFALLFLWAVKRGKFRRPVT
jgi:hypothetical protein